MASRPFAEISDQQIENLVERAIFQIKRKKATKYGMKNFYALDIQFCLTEIFFRRSALT